MRSSWVAAVAASLLVVAGCQSPAPSPADRPEVKTEAISSGDDDAGTVAKRAQTATATAKPPCVPQVLVAREGTPHVDGELDEPVWHAAAATDPFVHETANRVVPHTEARAAHDPDALYLAVYVADGDLRSSDQVAVAFDSGAGVEVTPGGTLTCHFAAQKDCAGVVAKLDRDGDVDADREEDEEYIVELKIPWKLLDLSTAPERLGVNFSRIETLDGERLREVWSRGCGELSLERRARD